MYVSTAECVTYGISRGILVLVFGNHMANEAISPFVR